MIVLEIDGVIANYRDELRFRLNAAGFHADNVCELDNCDFSEVYPDIPSGGLDLFLNDPLIVKNAKSFEDAWYWVNHFSSSYDIMFLTGRDISLTSPTWDWFREWDIPADFIVFQEDKIKFLYEILPTVYVDDDPEVISQAISVGVNAYLYNRPYNQEHSVPEGRRINSLWEIELP